MLIQNEVFEKISQDKCCDIAFPIKENFLLQIIKQFNQKLKLPNGYEFIFGGGTSLVCAYNELTKRFSEDGDFRIVPKPKHTKNIREQLEKIANSLTNFKLIDCKNDSQVITFLFIPIDFNMPLLKTIRPHIKIEICFTDNLFYKAETKKLVSSYNKYAGIDFETEMLCVSLEDTAIDKISSLLWKILSRKTTTSKYDKMDIRHLYDLTYLYPKLNFDKYFKNYLLKVCNSDIKDRLKTDEVFEDVVNKVLIELKTNKIYKKEFKMYVENISYEKTDKQLTF